MLRVGVIGTGDIARKSYLPGLHDAGRNIELSAVCDIVPGRAEAVAREFDAQAVYTDHREMLRNTALNLVIVLTPVATHAPFVHDVLQAGINVYSEKPVAMTHDEAEALCVLADAQNVRLFAAPLLMLYPEFEWLRETVRAGAVGKPTFARAHSSHGGANRAMWATDSGNFFRPDTGGPVPPLYDMGVYGLTILTHCLGPVRSVSALGGIGVAERRIDKVALPDFVPYTLDATVPDNVALLLDFGEACFATVDSSFCLPYKKGPTYEFYGYEGAVYFHGGDDGLELISEKPDFAAPGGEKPVAWHTHPLPEERRLTQKPKWGQILTRHVADVLQTGGPSPISGQHARHVVEIMERAQTALETGRTQFLTSRV